MSLNKENKQQKVIPQKEEENTSNQKLVWEKPKISCILDIQSTRSASGGGSDGFYGTQLLS